MIHGSISRPNEVKNTGASKNAVIDRVAKVIYYMPNGLTTTENKLMKYDIVENTITELPGIPGDYSEFTGLALLDGSQLVGYSPHSDFLMFYSTSKNQWYKGKMLPANLIGKNLVLRKLTNDDILIYDKDLGIETIGLVFIYSVKDNSFTDLSTTNVDNLNGNSGLVLMNSGKVMFLSPEINDTTYLLK